MSVGRIGSFGGLAPVTQPRDRAEIAGPGGFGDSLEGLLDVRRPAPPPVADATGEVRLSRHARARLESRGIEVPEEDLRQLGEAVDRLQERGARESLVLLGDNAWVVGVPSRTVITVMPRAEALGTVFTNIDSTFVAT